MCLERGRGGGGGERGVASSRCRNGKRNREDKQ